jgi:hypothetical protein
MDKQRGELGVDYVFDVPLVTAATMTGFRYNGPLEDDLFRNLRSLVPINGNVMTKLSHPPQWWQTVGSMKYE